MYNALTHHCVSKLEGHEGEISKVSCNNIVNFVNLFLLSLFLAWKFFFLEVIRRTLLVALSLVCLEMSFVVKGPSAVILLFRLEYKTRVVCHNVYTQKVKIARRDRPHILASNRCETFENLLHIELLL